MVASLSFNPLATSNAAGSFSIESAGFIQGQAMDDPATRNALALGYLASTETLPMWGGVGVTELIATLASSTTPANALGGAIGRATTLTAATTGQLTGFSVFDQAHGMISSPQSPVPLAGTYQTISFYRMGSNARIAVACDPTLVSLRGGLITQQVSWDFNDSILQPYDASTATYSVTSITSSYLAGVYTFAVVMASSSQVGAVGDLINVSGVTGTGASLVNGTQVVTSYTSATSFSFQVTAASGAIATGALSGTILLNYGTGALNVKVLDVVSNSMTVSYSTVTGFATWNRSGTCALIQI